MRKHSRLLLAGAVAALALGAAVGSASAGRILLAEQNFRVTWTPMTFEAAGFSVECNVTSTGSFTSRTVPKIIRGLTARISEARLGTCTGGTVTLLTETLPWHLTYEYFVGRLPRIERIGKLIVEFAARISPSGGTACLARTTTTEPGSVMLNVEGETVTGARLDETRAIDLEGGFLCDIAGDGHISGTGRVQTPAGPPLTIRLI